MKRFKQYSWAKSKVHQNVLIRSEKFVQKRKIFKKKPIKEWTLPKQNVNIGGKKVSPQEYFDESQIYVTIYLETEAPAKLNTEIETAEKSTLGLSKFRDELESLYSKNFHEISDIQAHPNEKIFILSQNDRVSVFYVPKEILRFSNDRERKRKPGPVNSFGSGLLLVRKEIYEMTPSAFILYRGPWKTMIAFKHLMG